MKVGDTLVRDSDGKSFRVASIGHWSLIFPAADKVTSGFEEERVKCIGGNAYVGQFSGEGYTLTDQD